MFDQLVFPPFFSSPIFLLAFSLGYFLKGVALWVSARRGEKIWFVVFVVVHTLGILEAIYLLIKQKTKKTSQEQRLS